jgi:hypothetical protein
LQLNGTSNFNVDSTGRTSFPLGTAALPALYPGADTNTGMWSPAADTLAWSTSGVERTRVDSAGRLLMGTSTARSGSNFKDAGYTSLAQVEGAADNQSYGSTFVANSGTTNNTARGCILTLGRTRGASLNSNTSVSSGDLIGKLQFSGADGTNLVPAAAIQGFVDGTPGTDNMPGRLTFSTTAGSASSPTERLRITSAGVLQVADAGNISVGTTTGTKIGTATTQKLGFYNATPVVQPAAVADATDAATVITQLNDLLAKLRTLGIIAT